MCNKINDLRNSLICVYKNKLSLHEWCMMYKSCESEYMRLHQTEKHIPFNDIVFPHHADDADDVYTKISETIYSFSECVELKKQQYKIPDSIIMPDEDALTNNIIVKHDEQMNLFMEMKQSSTWKNIIDELDLRKNKTDQEVLQDMKTEICTHAIKSLYQLFSFCLRFTFATDNKNQMASFCNDNVGFFKWSRYIHYIHAYKDKDVFERVLSSGLSAFCRELISFSVLNNTILAKIDGYHVVTRTIPFPNHLSESDILELLDCGIFPIGIIPYASVCADGFLMSGSSFAMHDVMHCATFIAPSMLSFYKTNIIDHEAECMKLSLYWYAYNFAIKEYIKYLKNNEFTEMDKHALFLFVHEQMGPAIYSCQQILASDMKFLSDDENTIFIRKRKLMKFVEDETMLTYTDCRDFSEKIRQIFITDVLSHNIFSTIRQEDIHPMFKDCVFMPLICLDFEWKQLHDDTFISNLSECCPKTVVNFNGNRLDKAIQILIHIMHSKEPKNRYVGFFIGIIVSFIDNYDTLTKPYTPVLNKRAGKFINYNDINHYCSLFFGNAMFSDIVIT